MIECPVCKTQNSSLAIVCVQCHGFLQTRVQTLDFFETIWQMTESPAIAMKRIILSEQKNYIHLLAGFFGIGIFTVWLWAVRGGWMFENLQWVILALILIGPLVGIAFLYLLSWMTGVGGSLLHGRASFRNTKVVVGYALFPVALASFFLVPLELGLFGMYLFTSNPPIEVVKPSAAYVLYALNGLACLWSLYLYVTGTEILFEWKKIQSVVLAIVCFALVCLLFFMRPW